MHRSVVFAAVVLGCWTVSQDPAAAGTFGSGHTSDDSVGAEVRSDGTGTASRSSGIADPNAPVCKSLPIKTSVEGLFRIDNNGEIVRLFDEQHQENKGAWYRETCIRRYTVLSERMYWVGNVDPAALAQQALDSAPIPTPRIAITEAPPVRTLVNMEMWTWIAPGAWAPVTATAAADGLTVTVTATPTSVRWDSGDPRGSINERTNICYGPGKAYRLDKPSNEQQSSCTYTYRHTSGRQPNLEFPLSATLTWHATWTGTDGSSGDLGNVARSSTVGVRVGESQALNVIPSEGP